MNLRFEVKAALVLAALVGGSLNAQLPGALGPCFGLVTLPEEAPARVCDARRMCAQMKAAQDELGLTEAAGVVQPNGTAK